ncbi:MAG TPA: hypothetical protein VFP34_00095 [Microlunatus sp.]|nr:hypothetical protein [Microlunatus sp.]
MRLVASSDPGAVANFDAKSLICERLVLANAVCNALDSCGGNYAETLPRTALELLRRWVGARYEKDVETHASDGLKEMIVPPGAEGLMEQLRIATGVCEDLAFLWTADTRSEYESDSKELSESLDCWRQERDKRLHHSGGV